LDATYRTQSTTQQRIWKEYKVIWYTCPACGMKVEFFEGFKIECKGRINNPAHSFTVRDSNEHSI